MYYFRSLATEFPSVQIIAAYRDAAKLKNASMNIIADAPNKLTSNITRLIIDLDDMNSSSNTIEALTETRKFAKLTLINNAGVCLEGNSQAVLEKSLTVNCISPAKINEILIALSIRKNFELTIINISSGEGELVFLQTDIQKQIALLETHKVRLNFENTDHRQRFMIVTYSCVIFNTKSLLLPCFFFLSSFIFKFKYRYSTASLTLT